MSLNLKPRLLSTDTYIKKLAEKTKYCLLHLAEDTFVVNRSINKDHQILQETF